MSLFYPEDLGWPGNAISGNLKVEYNMQDNKQLSSVRWFCDKVDRSCIIPVISCQILSHIDVR